MTGWDREFVCTDCGAMVYALNDPSPVDERCFTCRWIAEHPDAPQEVIDILRGHAQNDKGRPLLQ